MSDGGKGSKPRPFSVSQQEYGEKLEAIFGKKPPRVPYVYQEPADQKKEADSASSSSND